VHDVRKRLRSVAVCLAAAAICVAVAAGCGGDDDSTTVGQQPTPGSPLPPESEQPLSAAQLHGRDLFIQHCGSCHTLDAAGTVGQIGPNLDDIAINEADVVYAIRNGGGRHSRGTETGPTGNMPKNLVTGKDAQDVAAFVAASSSGSSTP
jgi:mono/diheme cytochrome c family protein